MSPRPTPFSKIALVTCLIACIGDFLVISIIGFLYKDYNSFTDSQSDLGTYNSPVAIYMNTWEVLLGLLLLTCSWSLYKTGLFKTRLQRFALWLLALYAMGEGIGSGLFPFNHVNHELTGAGWVHSIFSGVGITAMVILSFVMVKIFPKKKSPQLNKFFFSFACMGAVFIILCLLSRVHFLRFVGLWQRLYLLAYYMMLTTLTLQIFKTNENKSLVFSQ